MQQCHAWLRRGPWVQGPGLTQTMFLLAPIHPSPRPNIQGCLFGPILLSLLSAFYRLHGEFMGMVSADGERGGLGLTTPRAAVPALFASPFGTKGGERGSAPHSPLAPVLQPTPPTPRQGAHKGLELSPVDGCEDRVPARALAPAGTASAENGDSASDTSPLKEDSVPESFSFGYHPHEE